MFPIRIIQPGERGGLVTEEIDCEQARAILEGRTERFFSCMFDGHPHEQRRRHKVNRIWNLPPLKASKPRGRRLRLRSKDARIIRFSLSDLVFPPQPLYCSICVTLAAKQARRRVWYRFQETLQKAVELADWDAAHPVTIIRPDK